MCDTVVQLTPAGRGAIATLLIEGPNALRWARASFHSAGGRPLGGKTPDRLFVGHWGSQPPEPVVVRVQSEHSVEVHCHGGRAAVARLEQALVEQGCRRVAWQDWVRRRASDAIRAAAWIALAEARTERTAAILLDQCQGALSRAIQSIAELLAQDNATAADERLRRILGHVATGLHLVRPWRVVVAGPPNAGKSTLLNAIVGYARAIVDPRAGTTRDLVSSVTAVDGWLVELCDTAGLRDATHPVEQAGVAAARRALAEADLALLVFDLTCPWSASEEALVAAHPRAIVVHNKADLPAAPGSPRPPGRHLSALCQTGLEDLLGEISLRLVPRPPEPGEAVPFTPDQAEGLLRASDHLAQGDLAGAAHALEAMLRERSEQVANRFRQGEGLGRGD